MSEGWRPVVLLPDGTPEFMRGVEIGIVYERVRRGELGPHLMHASNTPRIFALAEGLGLKVRAEPVGEGEVEQDDEWYDVTFWRVEGGGSEQS